MGATLQHTFFNNHRKLQTLGYAASMQNLPHSRCDASYNRDVSPPLLYVRKLQYSSSAANTVPPAFSFLNPVSLSGSRVNLCFASLSHWNAAVYLMSFAFLSGSVHLDDWTWLVVVPRVVLEGAKFLFLVRLNQFTLWPNDITCWQNFSWSILVIKLLEDHAVFVWKKKKEMSNRHSYSKPGLWRLDTFCE